jgi:hypothetical protein
MLMAFITGRLITETLQSGRTRAGGEWRIERDRRLPGLLKDLQNAATGQTRLGTQDRRTKTDEAPLRFNTSARKIIADISTELIDITADLTKHTGIAYVAMDPSDIGSYALWIAHNTHQIAGMEDAGRIVRRVASLKDRAERCVDKPPSPRFCGQCDTKIDRKICGLALYAARDAIEVTCPNPQCRTVHNIEKLYNRTINSADNKHFPREVIIGNQRPASPENYSTGILGELEEFVHWQTFNRWLREKRFKPVMYLRPCGNCPRCQAKIPYLCEKGRRGFYRRNEGDIPEYRLADVRRVKHRLDAKARKVKTG